MGILVYKRYEQIANRKEKVIKPFTWIKALGKDSEINLCRVCDSLYSLVSRQRDCPFVCMSVCAYLNYFLRFWQIIKTKVSMDSLYKGGGFKTIYMRKGAKEKKWENFIKSWVPLYCKIFEIWCRNQQGGQR